MLREDDAERNSVPGGARDHAGATPDYDSLVKKPILSRLAGENKTLILFLIARDAATHDEVCTDDTSSKM
jgi:hypothetical protein